QLPSSPAERDPTVVRSDEVAPGNAREPEGTISGDRPSPGTTTAWRGDRSSHRTGAGPGISPPRFRRVRLHAGDERRRSPARPGGRFPRQPEEGPLRILRKRPGTLAALHRHPRANSQRLQGRRLERTDSVDERPPEARA